MALLVNDLIPQVEEVSEVELRDDVASLTDIKCTLVFPLSEAMFYEIKESLHRNVKNLLWRGKPFASPGLGCFILSKKIRFMSHRLPTSFIEK